MYRKQTGANKIMQLIFSRIILIPQAATEADFLKAPLADE